MIESTEKPETSQQANSDAPKKTIGQRMLRTTAVLPAMFTLLNGIAGFAAIHFTTKAGMDAELDATLLGNLQIAAGLIFAAMFCDMLDGRVARMTRTTSDFGAQLDSLCDMISFGVAPAMLTLRCSIGILRENIKVLPIERVIWAVAAVYVACAALRLARFNVETEGEEESAHMDFEGLPSPAAASCVSTMVLLLIHLMKLELSWLPADVLAWTMSILLPILMLSTALLMVSRFSYPHIANQYIRGKKPFSFLVKLVFIIPAVVFEPFTTIALLALVFAFSGPVRALFAKSRKTI